MAESENLAGASGAAPRAYPPPDRGNRRAGNGPPEQSEDAIVRRARESRVQWKGVPTITRLADPWSGWSWHWGPFVEHQNLPRLVAESPLRWRIEALAMLVIGLWSMGLLLYVLTLWWRSTWIALIAIVVLNALPMGFTDTGQGRR